MEIAVLGIGSPHGDDQVGWLLLDQLQQSPCLTQADCLKIHWEKVSSPVTSLVNHLSVYDYILVMDAADLGLTPGESLFLEDAEAAFEHQETVVSSHAMGLQESWQLAKVLQMNLPRISLYLVQFEQTEPMAPMSQSLNDKIPDMLEIVTHVLLQAITDKSRV